MIINADFTAGHTIEEAIEEALAFSERNHVGVRAKLNDIEMCFFYIPNMRREEQIKHYRNEYDFRRAHNEN